MSRTTKKDILAALADYPENAQIIFNDDETLRALDITEINFIDDDYAPDLCPEAPCPRIFIHLKSNM